MTEPGKVPDKATGLTRILRAFGYTFDGLKATFKSEAAFRQELAACVILAPVALYYGPGAGAHAGHPDPRPAGFFRNRRRRDEHHRRHRALWSPG